MEVIWCGEDVVEKMIAGGPIRVMIYVEITGDNNWEILICFVEGVSEVVKSIEEFKAKLFEVFVISLICIDI